jgi:hypothetical protein
MWRAIAGVLSIALGACAPGRVADLQDIGKLSIGAGVGASVDASLGFVSQPSFGFFSETSLLGSEARQASGYVFQKRVSFPYTFVTAARDGKGLLGALNYTGFLATYKVTGFQRGFEEIDRTLDAVPPREFGLEIEDVRYGGGVVGGRVGFNPLELLDFLLGLGGLDIAGDDPQGQPLPEAKTEH